MSVDGDHTDLVKDYYTVFQENRIFLNNPKRNELKKSHINFLLTPIFTQIKKPHLFYYLLNYSFHSS